jgi:hypothetical protein
LRIHEDPNDPMSKINNLEKEKEKEEAAKRKLEKIDNYAKYVKEMYFPKVSVKKVLELE